MPRYPRLLLCALATCATLRAQSLTIEWDAATEDIAASTDLGLAFNNTSVGVRDDTGTLHFVWAQANTARYGRLAPGATAWSITTLPRFSTVGTLAKPTLARVGTTLYCAWTEPSSLILARSQNLGATWETPLRVVQGNSAVMCLVATARSSGVAHAVALAYGATGTDKAYVTAWRGTTWSAADFTPPQLLSSGTGESRDPTLATDGAALIALWEDTRAGVANPQLYSARSADYGLTWSADTPVVNATGQILSGGDPSLVLLPGGKRWLAYQIAGTAMLAKSVNDGTSYTSLGQMGPGLFAQAVANSAGLVAVAFENFSGGLKNDAQKKIGLALSLDSGATFTTPNALPGSSTALGKTLVALVLGGTRLDVVWVDRAGATPTLQHRGATLTATAADPGRLINLSILASLATAEEIVTIGTVIGGAGTGGTKPLLVRAAGPSLTPLGVGGVLADPKLDLFSGQTVVAANDNWGGTAALSTAFMQVGAFAYASASSRDAALVGGALAPGNYTVQITGAGGASGLVLAELYDATPNGSFTATTPRLINVSVLKKIALGEILTAGFVIGGSAAKQVLVRAIGPTLAIAPFNVAGTMADPKIELFSGPTRSNDNDNWGGAPALVAAFGSVGAFALDATSRDAALLVTLQPGSYTAQVTGGAGSAGLALVEVYEVP